MYTFAAVIGHLTCPHCKIQDMKSPKIRKYANKLMMRIGACARTMPPPLANLTIDNSASTTINTIPLLIDMDAGLLKSD